MTTLYPQEAPPTWDDGESPARAAPAALKAFREGLSGRFPPRYATDVWRAPFDRRLVPALAGAEQVLDVGAGAWPVLPPGTRPRGLTYVGLDVDERELRRAPPGAYDQLVVSDVSRPDPALVGRFDLVVCWFVLEHVPSLPDALATMRSYLRPGGRLLAQFSARYSIFSVVNRLLPDPLALEILRRTTGRRPETVFPAVYDRARRRQVSELLGSGGWTHAEVVPLFVSGGYLRFSRPLLATFLAFEEIAWRRGWSDVAAYYLVDARRDPVA